jgi:hypothetical protein
MKVMKMIEQEKDTYKGPFWRSNGAIFIVLKSLADVERILNKMLREQRIVDSKLDVFYAKYPLETESSKSDEVMEEFGDICEKLWDLESNLSCSTRTAILMAIIELESTVNMFCYFNLGEIVTDSIENLSLAAKLEVAHRVLGLPEFKGTHQHRAIRTLLNWRNAFAHGKCTDMPSGSIRDNHLKEPEKYSDPGEEVQEMLHLLRDYLVVSQHIHKISKHPYTAGYSVEVNEIGDWLEKLRTFQFDEGQLVSRRRPKQ